MRRLLGMLVGLALIGCGDNGAEMTQPTDTTTTTTTTEPEPSAETLSVRVVSEIVGLGCTRTAIIGNGSRLEVRGDDETLGVGTWQLTEGASSCDWTAEADEVPADRGFYRLLGDGEELVTVSRDELESLDWAVELFIDINRRVELEDVDDP
jgi:hypothetical protein